MTVAMAIEAARDGPLRLMAKIGAGRGISFASFLKSSERAGRTRFLIGPQANAALAAINNTKEGWTGTILPARMASVVQRQADWNWTVL
jgi:hypothetical protein